MPGLIQNAQQAAAPDQATGAPPAAAGAPGGAGAGAQPDPQQVSMVVHAAMKIIHDPKVSPKLVEQMRSIGDPAQALAQVTVQIMKMIFEKSGKKIPPEVLGAAGVQTLQLLGELAQSAGLFEMTMDIFKQAAQAAQELAKQAAGGGAPPGGTEGAPPPDAAAAAPAGGVDQSQLM